MRWVHDSPNDESKKKKKEQTEIKMSLNPLFKSLVQWGVKKKGFDEYENENLTKTIHS